MKKNSGITLVALIITIIIMLILAGVTISIVGGSDGIVAKAEKAVSQTDKAAMGEDAELSIAAIKMDYYENYAANRAKYANAKAFIVAYLKTSYKTSRGATMVADSEGNVTYTYKGVATEVTLTDDGSVSFGESSGSDNPALIGETYYGDSSVVPTDAKYFTFSVNEDGQTATITGIKDEYAVKGYYDTFEINRVINDNGTYITEVVIPYEYIDEDNNKYPVTIVGTEVFGNSYYTWGGYSGDDEMFTSIKLPNTIEKIEQGAFVGARKLTQIDIPNSVTEIGSGAFSSSGLISVNIPEGIKNLGVSTFMECCSLSSVNIPASLTTIHDTSFNGCINLANITVDQGNTVYDSRDNSNAIIETATNTLIIGTANTIIPESVTSIRSYAFAELTNLTSIDIPENVKNIGKYAFAYCRNLKDINILNGVTSIEDYAFIECTSLSSINIPNSVANIGVGAFFNWTSSQTINCEAASKPSGWSNNWNGSSSAKINWGVSM